MMFWSVFACISSSSLIDLRHAQLSIWNEYEKRQQGMYKFFKIIDSQPNSVLIRSFTIRGRSFISSCDKLKFWICVKYLDYKQWLIGERKCKCIFNGKWEDIWHPARAFIFFSLDNGQNQKGWNAIFFWNKEEKQHHQLLAANRQMEYSSF